MSAFVGAPPLCNVDFSLSAGFSFLRWRVLFSLADQIDLARRVEHVLNQTQFLVGDVRNERGNGLRGGETSEASGGQSGVYWFVRQRCRTMALAGRTDILGFHLRAVVLRLPAGYFALRTAESRQSESSGDRGKGLFK